MTLTITPLARQKLKLAKRFEVGDTTIQVVGRFQITSTGSYLIGKQFAAVSPATTGTEGIFLNITSQPTAVSGKTNTYEYPVATRGLHSDNVSIPPTLYSTDNQRDHEKGAVIAIVADPSLYADLADRFVEGSSEETAIAGAAITIRKAVAINSTNGKLYHYDTTNANHTFVGISKGTYAIDATATYINSNGGRSTGHTGLTAGAIYYASTSTAGDLTSSSNAYPVAQADASGTILFPKTFISTPQLSEAQAIDSTNTSFGSISGQRLAQAIDNRPWIDIDVKVADSGVAGDALQYQPGYMVHGGAAGGFESFGLTSPNTQKLDIGRGIGSGFSWTNTVTLSLSKQGTPADNVILRIETDDGTGKPSGTLAHANATASVAGSGISANPTVSNHVFTWAGAFTLTYGVKYHPVLTRSGSLDGSNYYYLAGFSYSGTDKRDTTYAYPQKYSGASPSWGLTASIDDLYGMTSSGSYLNDGLIGISGSTGATGVVGISNKIITRSNSDVYSGRTSLSGASSDGGTFLGIANSDFSVGDTISVTVAGFTKKLSGLTAGSGYKASSTPGVLTTQGYNKTTSLALATSTTSLYINNALI